MDRGKGRGVERAQVDALHLGAERGAGRPNAQEAAGPGRRVPDIANLLVHRGSLDTAGSMGTVAVGSMASEQTAPTSSSAAEMKSGGS